MHEFSNFIAQKTVLITGGAGFIGSNLAKRCLELGAKVRVLDNLMTGHKRNIADMMDHPNFRFIEGDIADLECCREVCKGVDYLSHQAALGSVPRSFKHPEATNQNNVTGFLNMLIAAHEMNVKQIVYASSSSVYGSEATLPKIESRIGVPLSPYAVSKYTNELYAKVYAQQYNTKIIGLRYFNVFGPNQDPNGPYAAVIPVFIHNLKNKLPVYINGDGLTTRDFTYVQNAVEANLCALSCQQAEAYGQAFNVACGQNYSLMDLFKTLSALIDPTARPVHREFRAGDIRDSLADISYSQRLLGYQPSVSFAEGLKLTVDWYESVNKS